jgi:hypothetical protein
VGGLYQQVARLTLPLPTILDRSLDRATFLPARSTSGLRVTPRFPAILRIEGPRLREIVSMWERWLDVPVDDFLDLLASKVELGLLVGF